MIASSVWVTHSIVTAVTLLAVVLSVILHYEVLTWLMRTLRHVRIPPRPRILLLIFSILCIHIVQIWIFGGAYFWLIQDVGRGALVASSPVGLLDCVYFSAVCFTTLGLGDMFPIGAIRFMTGAEALCGLVLITWSGSFTFVEMQRFWKQ